VITGEEMVSFTFAEVPQFREARKKQADWRTRFTDAFG
jgi:hypothetical protein